MALTLKLSAGDEEQLEIEASQQGLSATEYACRLLEEHLRQKHRQTEAIAQIESWIVDGDEEEQRETGDYLIEALDVNRARGSSSFPS
ncbi:hypothetical protein GC175_16920 [bacterium]|nr:hypothetical protein [bacterium]